MEDEARAQGSSDFGMLLRQYRIAAGLSQEALAERARMSVNGIGALERGDRRTPQRETLALLAGALSLDEAQREEFQATAGRSSLARPLRGPLVSGGSGAGTAVANLPFAQTSFVGRELELDEIAALVSTHRLVTLTGAGGVGKTQTALHAAAKLRDSGESLVCFVALAPISDPSLVATTIAATLGVQGAPNRPMLEALTAYLKSKTLLLILDNCEHVIEETAIVAHAVLPACPRVRILATSREPFRTAGEYTYRLPPLASPPPEVTRTLSATAARAYSAIMLFTDRACAIDHRFALTDDNAPIVGDICRRLDGIPLAIELAAARVTVLSVKALNERLDDRLQILTGGGRTALTRQQTMRATIDWSYDLLAAAEKRVFERLSVFAGVCTLAGAAAVCIGDDAVEGDVLDPLLSLVDKSVVVADLSAGEPRYRLLESFGQYAREKLAERDEYHATARRHALAYLELAETLDRVSFSQPNAAKRDILMALAREELNNFRVALEWALTNRRDILLGQRLTGELCMLWQTHAPLEGQRWVSRALESVDERTPASTLAKLESTAAAIAFWFGQYEVQLTCSRSAVVNYRVAGDPIGIAIAQAREAQALLNLGRTAEARSALREALPPARGAGNGWLVAWITRLFAENVVGDEIAAARAYIAEALQYYEAVGSKREVAFANAQLGRIEFRLGNAELALQYATGALATFRTLSHSLAIASTLGWMATYLISLSRYSEGETAARESLEVAREHSLSFYASLALQHIVAAVALRPQGLLERGPTECARLARVLGFADHRLAAPGLRWNNDQQREYAQVRAVLDEALGADTVAKRIAEGAAMSEDEAVDEALAV
jgi:predicted ATPase/transcriptional regulator with XRE-family HTH domain